MIAPSVVVLAFVMSCMRHVTQCSIIHQHFSPAIDYGLKGLRLHVFPSSLRSNPSGQAHVYPPSSLTHNFSQSCCPVLHSSTSVQEVVRDSKYWLYVDTCELIGRSVHTYRRRYGHPLPARSPLDRSRRRTRRCWSRYVSSCHCC